MWCSSEAWLPMGGGPANILDALHRQKRKEDWNDRNNEKTLLLVFLL
jgi:hypothetical protein